MKKRKKEDKNNQLLLIIVGIIIALSFFCLSIRIIELSTSKVVEGTNLQDFASNRTNRKDPLVARRGSIYDINGNVIAQNVSSYTLIAYLEPKRTTNEKNPQHVIDKEETARQLATVIDLSEELFLEQLNKRDSNPDLYQVEFGPKTKGLTELQKDEILALGLPGLDFIESQKRYYPYGDFMSYAIGYVKETVHPDDSSKMILVGEMGIEKEYNDILSGTDGYNLYQKDLRGYKIPGTKEVTVLAQDGKDIYLTIDVNVQLFLEQTINKAEHSSRWGWMSVVLANAKTGEIMAMSSDPSFDPNKRNMTSYLDLNTAVAFEPGSTMKIFSFMAAMEKGIYDGRETYKSGTYTIADGTEIGDWRREGWGYISYDQGFSLSSNTAIINLIRKGLSANELREYYKKLGFGTKTGIELPNESAGKLNFKYEAEVLNAGFGQGLTTTAMQNVKALTALTNDGTILNPQLVNKIIDPNNGATIYQAKKEVGETVASKTTVSKMTELMTNVIEGTSATSTGFPYYMPGYKLAAKTGTAQVAHENGRGYSRDVVKALAGFFPYDEPEVIIYVATKNPSDRKTGSDVTPMKTIVNDLVKNVSSYLKIYDGNQDDDKQLVSYTLPSLVNEKTKDIETKYKAYGIETIVIGNGDKLIKQYPARGTKISSNDKLILLTNSPEITMPNFLNLSHKEALVMCEFLNIKCLKEGTGYVVSQSIPVNQSLSDTPEIHLVFKTKEIS